jgi:hypothetical protein
MVLAKFHKCFIVLASVAALSFLQAASDPNNLITNGDFSNGETGWEYYNHHGGEGNAKIVDGQLVYQVTKFGTSSYWDVQVNTNVKNFFTLTKGTTYVLTFDAKCQTVIEDTMLLFAVEWGAPDAYNHRGTIAYDPAGKHPVPLTTSMKTFTSTFMMAEATTSEARLTFNVGGTLNTITFDNISLIDKSKVGAVQPLSLSPTALDLSSRIVADSRGITFRISDPAHFKYKIFSPAGSLIAGSNSFSRSSASQYRIDYRSLGISSGTYVAQAIDGNQRSSKIISVMP